MVHGFGGVGERGVVVGGVAVARVGGEEVVKGEDWGGKVGS
jgi:hypothetical protein